MLEALCLAAPFMLLPFLGAAGYVGAVRYYSATVAEAPAAQRESPPQSDMYRLASIMYVPWTGIETCEQRRFDNLTGRIAFDGKVACEFPPPAENGNQELRLSNERFMTATERMRAIHESFKK